MRANILLLGLCASVALLVACGDDSATDGTGDGGATSAGPSGPAAPGAGPGSTGATPDTSGPGSGGGGVGGNGTGGGEPDCYENPQTHLEIINACTDAEAIDKDPELPLLNEDGSLPPLP